MKFFDLRTLHPELVFPSPPFRIEEAMFQAPTLNSGALMDYDGIPGRSLASRQSHVPALAACPRQVACDSDFREVEERSGEIIRNRG